MQSTAHTQEIYDRFSIDPQYGFLPSYIPIKQLPAGFEAWDQAAESLPQFLTNQEMKACIAALPEMDLDKLEGIAEIERAFMIVTHLAHAWIWETGEMRDYIPAKIAVPFAALADHLGRPAVVHHAVNVLYNWEKLDPEKGMQAENLRALIGFDNSDDEHWFYNITTEIEAVGAPALGEMIRLRESGAQWKPAELSQTLQRLRELMEEMSKSLKRMTLRCKPERFYHNIRPFVASYAEVSFEGVEQNPVRSHAGGSAAQSTLIQAFDIVLGIKHPHASGAYLLKMRDYMPPAHKAFLEWLEAGLELNEWIKDHEGLKAERELLLKSLMDFRNTHMKIVSQYIAAPARKSGGSTEGTGGTDALSFLKEVRNDMKPSKKNPQD